MITQEVKTKIVQALKVRRESWGGTDRGFAGSIGINPAAYSRIQSGVTFQVLSEPQWLSLARFLEIDLNGESKWKIANTATYEKITTQLASCQKNSISGIFCDDADLGKTFAAKQYVKTNKFAVYIDCSQVKSKPDLVRQIAKEFGLGHTGRYRDVYGDLCYYLKNVAQSPLIILDEAGDLDKSARLELKALWNAAERTCAWYQMGADGLKEVIRRGIENKVVGYVETFSRYGSRYQKSTPDEGDKIEDFKRSQAAMILRANAPEGTSEKEIQKLLIKTGGSLRRVYTELNKRK